MIRNAETLRIGISDPFQSDIGLKFVWQSEPVPADGQVGKLSQLSSAKLGTAATE